MDVEHLPVMPARGDVGGDGDHVGIVGKQLPGRERRRGEAALALPEFALAGEQALTEEGRDMAPYSPVLDEIAGVPDQHMLDRLHVVDEHGRPAGEVDPHEVAIGPRVPFEEADLVAAEIEDVAEQRQALRAGNRRGDRGSGAAGVEDNGHLESFRSRCRQGSNCRAGMSIGNTGRSAENHADRSGTARSGRSAPVTLMTSPARFAYSLRRVS